MCTNNCKLSVDSNWEGSVAPQAWVAARNVVFGEARAPVNEKLWNSMFAPLVQSLALAAMTVIKGKVLVHPPTPLLGNSAPHWDQLRIPMLDEAWTQACAWVNTQGVVWLALQKDSSGEGELEVVQLTQEQLAAIWTQLCEVGYPDMVWSDHHRYLLRTT